MLVYLIESFSHRQWSGMDGPPFRTRYCTPILIGTIPPLRSWETGARYAIWWLSYH